MSSKQTISKHRPGGGPSQSNQRQADYSRPNERFPQSHPVRQNSTGVSQHLPSAPVNMPQPTSTVLPQNPQPIPSNQIIRNYQNNNQAPLIQSQGMNLVNNPPPQAQISMMNAQRYAYIQPSNANRMPNTNRPPRMPFAPNIVASTNYPVNPAFPPYNSQPPIYPMYNPSFSSGANIPYQFSNILYYSDNPMGANFNHNYTRPFIGTAMHVQTSHTNVNSEVNNTPAFKTNEPSQNKKREKKPAHVFDEYGNPLDLKQLAQSTSSVADTPESEIRKNTRNAEDMPINGANREPKSSEKNVINDDASTNSEKPVPEPIEEKPNLTVDTEQPSENSSCDINEIIDSNNILTAEAKNEPEAPQDLNEVIQGVDEITIEDVPIPNEKESQEDICVTEKDEVAEQEEIVDAKENESLNQDLASRDENTVTCENMDPSGDMSTVELQTSVLNDGMPTPDTDPIPSKPPTPVTAVDKGEDNAVATNEIPSENNINEKLEVNKQYKREELLSLRHNASKCSLTNPNHDIVKDITRDTSSENTSDSLLPLYAKSNRTLMDQPYRNKSAVQPYRRQAQPPRNSDPRSRKPMSHPEFHDDAWRPGKIKATDPEEIETENLLKSVRAILNKLTPQNYHVLLEQFKGFKIDSKNRLTRVIDLIFEKAVREPAFVVQYAGFCSQLIHIKVTEENEKNETVQVKFKNLLIEKCQKTFYENMYSNPELHQLSKQIEECEDPVKRKELEEILDDEKRMYRKRSVGNIKLIAELYKLNMLNAKIMFSCFEYLLKDGSAYEEYIECLCALMTNIGKNLTDAIKTRYSDMGPKFDSVFDELNKIYNGQSELKVSSRIRFMILDLMDLRKNNWVPRRKTEGPKLLAQVHEDMEIQQRMKNESLNEMKKKKNTVQQDGWQEVNKRKSHPITRGNLNLTSLLKDITENKSNTSATAFSFFKAGSHGGSTPSSQSRSSSTNYENKNQNLPNDRNQRAFHDSLNAKNQHVRRDERKISDVTSYQLDKRNDSNSSQNRSNSTENLKPVQNISIEDFTRKTSQVIDKHLESGKFSDIVNDINSFCSKTKYTNFITESIIVSLEKTSPQSNPREKWGQFLGRFFQTSNCENVDIFESLKRVFAVYEDYKLDIPKYFEFVAEVLAHALLVDYEENSGKQDLLKAIKTAYNEISGNECQLFRESFCETIAKNNPNLHDKIKPYFLSNPEIKNDKLTDIIDNYMKSNDLNELKAQLERNYPDEVSSESFKSALYYKLLNASWKSPEPTNVGSKLDKIRDVFEYYVKSKEDQVLFLIQCSNLYKDFNHPFDMLREIFVHLFEKQMVEKSSFLEFEAKSKGDVSLASVTRFMEKLCAAKI